MADVELIPAVCPKCGASLRFPADMDKAHCMYCGTQIIIGRTSHYAAECKVCDGFGRIDVCRACNGSGECTWHMSSTASANNNLALYMTYGTESHCVDGYCYACRGTGNPSAISACPYCGGTGRCPRCLGTAKCSACRGIGVIPGPSGSQVCPGCGGKGHLEGEPPKAPEMDRCPECQTPMDKEMFFCQRCGFSRGCPRCKSAWPKGSLMCPKCGFKKGGKV